MQKPFFSEDIVEFVDFGNSMSGRTQEGALIRALLCCQKLHWLDGFLVFDTWVKGEQEGDYKALFKTIASRASGHLKKMGIEARIGVIRRGQGYFRMHYSKGVGLKTNIEQMVQLLGQSRRLFALGNKSGWDPIMNAMGHYVSPANLCRSLVLADELPEDMDLWSEPLDRIIDLVKHYRVTLVEAVTRVSKKAASRNNQGITFANAAEPLAVWLIEVLNINKILQLLGGHAKPRLPDKRTDEEQFLGWIRSLVDSIEGCLEAVATSDPEAQAIKNEQSAFLEEIAQKPLVQKIKRKLLHSYDECPQRKLEPEDVDISIKTALYETALLHRDCHRGAGDALCSFQKLFEVHVKGHYVEDRVLKKICSSDALGDTQKSRQILSLLKQIKGDDKTDEPHLQKVTRLIRGDGGLSDSDAVQIADRLQFRYLKPIEQVLRIGTPEKPRWFRKTGPIAADFMNNRIYRRERELEELKHLVLRNSVSMLEGVSATGKTVLTLNLAYDLHLSGEHDLYYFDCDRDRDFDVGGLKREIEQVRGIFILENIHLNPEKFQTLYFDFKHDQERIILLTTRPCFKEFQASRLDDLTDISSIQLRRFRHLNAIVNSFICQHDIPEIGACVLLDIREACSNNLWLLSYALMGYAESNGLGDSGTWLEKGVLEDLNDLEKLNSVFPEILVIISALYRKEVLMEETYLVHRLGYDCEALNQLVRRGEITRQNAKDGVVFYGLPHTSLAEAYWKYGSVYKKRLKISDYDEFLLDYAISGSGNALQIIIKADMEVQERVVEHLNAEGRLTCILENERFPGIVFTWVNNAHHCILSQDCVLTALVHRIENCSDFIEMPWRIAVVCRRGEDIANRFWEKLDNKKVMKNISDSGSVLSILSDNFSLNNPLPDVIAEKIWALLNPKDVALKLNRIKDVAEIGKCLATVLRANEIVGQKIWDLLDKKTLSKQLVQRINIDKAAQCITYIQLGNQEKANEISRLIDITEMAAMLKQTNEVEKVGELIASVYRANERLGEGLWGLTKKSIAKKMNESGQFAAGELCIRALQAASQNTAIELCHLLNPESLASCFRLNRDIEGVAKVIAIIETICKDVSGELWLLCKEEMALTFLKTNVITSINNCIRDISSASTTKGKELCDLLEYKTIGSTLSKSNQHDDIREIITTIYSINMNAALRLISCFDIEELANKLSRLKDINETEKYIELFQSINFEGPKLAKKLCGSLKINEFSSNLNNALGYGSIGRYVCVINNANPKIGSIIWKLLDKKRLAIRISRSRSLYYDLACIHCLRTMGCAEKAYELCSLLDIKRISETLNSLDNFEHVVGSVSKIITANLQVGENILDLLNLEKVNTALKQLKYFQAGIKYLYLIHYTEPEKVQELCRYMDLDEIAKTMITGCKIADIEWCITAAYQVNEEFGWTLWNLLDKRGLAERIIQKESLKMGDIFITKIDDCCKEMASEFCQYLNLHKLKDKLLNINSSSYDDISFLRSLCDANEGVCDKLGQLLDLEYVKERCENMNKAMDTQEEVLETYERETVYEPSYMRGEIFLFENLPIWRLRVKNMIESQRNGDYCDQGDKSETKNNIKG